MSIAVKTIQPSDLTAWDEYVSVHPQSTLYHLAGWKNVIEKTYGHKIFYLMAQNGPKVDAGNSKAEKARLPSFPAPQHQADIVVGILPLVHLKHFIFGNSLISMPFFDMGGILADDEETEKKLLIAALKLAQKLGAKTIELRNHHQLSCLNQTGKVDSSRHATSDSIDLIHPISYSTRSSKVRMLLNLPQSSETLIKSFKSKLRSQIRKPIKEGLKAKVGGLELLDDFFTVFAVNMRDLGSPVHTKKLMHNVLEEFSDWARLVMVYKGNRPVAGSLIVGFKDILENPWASALKKYRRLSPNMLLYWTMLEYACDNGYRKFDFGRSTPGEGTYKFKAQWGAEPQPLRWSYISLNDRPSDTTLSEKPSFEFAARLWQKLPVSAANLIGPRLRKYIGL